MDEIVTNEIQASPQLGSIVYNATTGKTLVYDGTQWLPIRDDSNFGKGFDPIDEPYILPLSDLEKEEIDALKKRLREL